LRPGLPVKRLGILKYFTLVRFVPVVKFPLMQSGVREFFELIDEESSSGLFWIGMYL
jgi:hypothetical protein